MCAAVTIPVPALTYRDPFAIATVPDAERTVLGSSADGLRVRLPLAASWGRPRLGR